MFDYTYSIFPLTLAGCPILALAGVGCLIRCRGKDRRRLAWAAGVFSCYEYPGPLVRRTERLYDGETHVCGDFD